MCFLKLIYFIVAGNRGSVLNSLFKLVLLGITLVSLKHFLYAVLLLFKKMANLCQHKMNRDINLNKKVPLNTVYVLTLIMLIMNGKTLLRSLIGHFHFSSWCWMNILSKFQLPCSSGLGLKVLIRYLDYRMTCPASLIAVTFIAIM